MQPLQYVTFATAIAMGVAFAAAPVYAQAQQKFPSKPVRIVVPNPAGSQGGTVARMLGHKLSERWGQPVVVDNRTGGIGTVAGSTVVKAAPDGHTLLQSAGFAVSAALQTSLPYDPLKDFSGVAQIGIGTQVLVVAPALGVKSVKDFIALAKAQPGKMIYGSSAVGTGSHLNGARFNPAAGIKAVTVAFKGGAGSDDRGHGRAHPLFQRDSVLCAAIRQRWEIAGAGGGHAAVLAIIAGGAGAGGDAARIQAT